MSKPATQEDANQTAFSGTILLGHSVIWASTAFTGQCRRRKWDLASASGHKERLFTFSRDTFSGGKMDGWTWMALSIVQDRSNIL